jgi:hypothetical protein
MAAPLPIGRRLMYHRDAVERLADRQMNLDHGQAQINLAQINL